MKPGLRKAFRAFTFLLLLVTAFTVYSNIASDDTAVRARAGEVVRAHLGCGEKCKITYTHISRGMLDERFVYTIDGKGNVEVVCRRALVIAGDHTCTPQKPD